MNSLPLVGAEVQRIDAAFMAVSSGLAEVVASLRDVDLTGVGTPSADPAVATGMRDLGAALARLQSAADECVVAMRRHGAIAGVDGAHTAAGADAAEVARDAASEESPG